MVRDNGTEADDILATLRAVEVLVESTSDGRINRAELNRIREAMDLAYSTVQTQCDYWEAEMEGKPYVPANVVRLAG